MLHVQRGLPPAYRQDDQVTAVGNQAWGWSVVGITLGARMVQSLARGLWSAIYVSEGDAWEDSACPTIMLPAISVNPRQRTRLELPTRFRRGNLRGRQALLHSLRPLVWTTP